MDPIDTWLRKLGLERHVNTFVENEISFEALALLTEDDLRELELPLGPRKIILAEVERLRAESAAGGGKEITEDPAVERRHLTVMMCDLVGSTELSRRLDPEEIRRVTYDYQIVVARCVERFGGHVANYQGDGVVVYFGWPNAREDQAQQAVRAAIATVAEVASISIPGADDDHLAAHVGLASGLVVVGKLGDGVGLQRGAISGETPNLAARLESVAGAGQIALADDTRRLVESDFELTYHGVFDLKGIGKEIDVWRVVAEKTDLRRLQDLRRRYRSMVGRHHELGMMLEKWNEATSGYGGAILISGEPGVGKSRIVQALCDELGSAASLFTLHCSQNHSANPLFPVVSMLRREVGGSQTDPTHDDVSAWVKRTAGRDDDAVVAVCDLLGLQQTGAANVTAVERRTTNLRAVARLVESASSRGPLLLAVEDAHWIDPSTADLLASLVQNAASRQLFIVITHRPEWRAPFAHLAAVHEIGIRRLSQKHVKALVRDLAGDLLGDEDIERIAERTDGVPLFVEELTRSLLETGLDRSLDQVPNSLQASLMARLDRLGPAKSLAQIASVIGRTFSEEMLVAISERPTDEIRHGLNRLVSAQLVFRAGSSETMYIFKHALVQDIAYGSLLKERRRYLHAALAAILGVTKGESDLGVDAVIAHHLQEAGEAQKASQCWEAAGDEAMRRSAQAEAVDLYQRAIQQSLAAGAEEPAVSLMLRLGQAQFGALGGAAPATRETFGKAARQAEAGGDAGSQCLSLYGQWVGEAISGELDAATNTAHRVMELAESEDAAWMRICGHRIRAGVYALAGQLHEACDECESVLKIAAVSDGEMPIDLAHDPLLTTRPTLAHIRSALGEISVAASLAREGVMLAVDHRRSPNSVSFALVWESMVLAQIGAVAPLRRAAEALVEHTDRTGARFWGSITGFGLGYADFLEGQAESGATLIGATVEAFTRTGAVLHAPAFMLARIEALVALGEFDQCTAELENCDRLIERTGQAYYRAECDRLLALTRLATGHVSGAREAFRSSLDTAVRQDAKFWKLKTCVSLVASGLEIETVDAASELRATLTVVQDFEGSAVVDQARELLRQLSA